MGYVLLLIFFIPIIIADMWAVWDIASFSYKLRRDKWLWTNVVLFFPLFGVFVYILWGKRRLKNKLNDH